MSRTIVVVTCEKDKYEFELLCRTIQKFLEPSRLIFVCNEYECDDWFSWYKTNMAPLLKKHRVKLFKKHDFWSYEHEEHLHELQKEGWIDQQVIKLAVAKHVDTKDYICLDSKNFFIRPCNVFNIKQAAPISSDWAGELRQNWIKLCCRTLGVRYPGEHIKLTGNITPYILDKQQALNLVEHFGGSEKLYVWFSTESLPESISPGEFFLYEIWLIKHGLRDLKDSRYTQQNIYAIWGDIHHNKLNFEYKDYVESYVEHIQLFDCYMASVHRSMYPYWTESLYRKFMKTIGLEDCIPLQTCPYGNEERIKKMSEQWTQIQETLQLC